MGSRLIQLMNQFTVSTAKNGFTARTVQKGSAWLQNAYFFIEITVRTQKIRWLLARVFWLQRKYDRTPLGLAKFEAREKGLSLLVRIELLSQLNQGLLQRYLIRLGVDQSLCQIGKLVAKGQSVDFLSAKRLLEIIKRNLNLDDAFSKVIGNAQSGQKLFYTGKVSEKAEDGNA